MEGRDVNGLILICTDCTHDIETGGEVTLPLKLSPAKVVVGVAKAGSWLGTFWGLLCTFNLSCWQLSRWYLCILTLSCATVVFHNIAMASSQAADIAVSTASQYVGVSLGRYAIARLVEPSLFCLADGVTSPWECMAQSFLKSLR
jgi:hypothetical protein